MKPEPPNEVHVTLPDGMFRLTEAGDHDILIADGTLTVHEYSEPRNTGSMVAIYAPGQWLSAFVCRSKA